MTIEGDRAAFKTRPLVLLCKTAMGALLALGLVLLSLPASEGGSLAAGAAPKVRVASRLDIRVIDGDTFEDRVSGVRYRLADIDTPETGGRALCAAERVLGNRAAAALRALLSGAESVEILPIGALDRYGRTLARVEVNGRDLGTMLVAHNLARVWGGRREPWCDSSGRLMR